MCCKQNKAVAINHNSGIYHMRTCVLEEINDKNTELTLAAMELEIWIIYF